MRTPAALPFVLVALAASAGCASPDGSTPPEEVLTSPVPGETTECQVDQPLLLEVAGTDYRVTGECTEVRVIGEGIDVDAQSIGTLVVQGDDNEVDADSIGDLTIEGDDNYVEAGSLESVTIMRGNDNEIEVGGRVEFVEINGDDNEIESDEGFGDVVDNGEGNDVDG